MQKTAVGFCPAVALFLCSLAVPAHAADVGFDMSVAKQAAGRGRSESKMAFLHLQFPNRLHDNFELVNEITAGRMEEPVHGYVIGVNEVGRISFAGTRKSSPFLDVGMGVNYFGPHEGVPEVSGPMQFSLVLGAGFRFKPKNARIAYVLEYRMTHFSNAETMKPNVGLNLHTVGVSFIFLSKP